MAEKKSSNATKNILMVVFILAACGFVWMQMQKRALIKKESQAIQTYNDGKYEEAIKLFEALLPNAKGEALKRHNSNLAKCYIGMAEKTGLSVEDQVKLYKQANDYDAEAITSPAIRKLLESHTRKQEMAATGDAEKKPEPPEKADTE